MFSIKQIIVTPKILENEISYTYIVTSKENFVFEPYNNCFQNRSFGNTSDSQPKIINYSNTVQKAIFNRKSYNIQRFSQTLKNGNWSQFYQQTCAEDTSLFLVQSRKSFEKHVSLTTEYIQNSKSKLERKRRKKPKRSRQVTWHINSTRKNWSHSL